MDNKTRCQHNVPDHLCPKCREEVEVTMDKTAEIFNETIKTYLNSYGDKGVAISKLEQFINEVSREVAIKFTSNYLQVEKELIEPDFNKWKSKQEDKPGDSDGQTFSPRI